MIDKFVRKETRVSQPSSSSKKKQKKLFNTLSFDFLCISLIE